MRQIFFPFILCGSGLKNICFCRSENDLAQTVDMILLENVLRLIDIRLLFIFNISSAPEIEREKI